MHHDFSLWCTGTVPAGGEKIVLISIERRNNGFRLVIETDEVAIVIDIP